MMRRSRAAALALLLAGGLAACGSPGTDTLADQARKGDNKGYIDGTGAMEQIPADKRGEAVRLAGPLLDGASWDVAGEQGKVVVLNVWGSWCAPCAAEMPLLQKTWTSLSTKHSDVRFIGVDVAESADTGRAAARSYGLTYPSISDPDRALTMGLQGKASATPTTLVLDRRGRIAARVSGQIASESILTGMVEDVLKEG